MSLGSCEFYVDEQRVELSIPQAWGRAALPERARLVRAFMSERRLPAYVEPRLLEAVALLEPQPDPEVVFGGPAAEVAVGAWARLLDGEICRRQGAPDSDIGGANDDEFDAAFRAIMTAGACSTDGGPGWRQLADMEESYASVLQELMVEHRNALEELQQLQHKEMTAQLGAGGNAQHLTTAARRRRAAATEALVHTHVTQLQEQRAQQEEERTELQAAQRANYRSLAVSIAEEEEAGQADAKRSPPVFPQTLTEQTTTVESKGGATSWLAGKAMAMANSVAQIALYSAAPTGEQRNSSVADHGINAESPALSAASDHESASSVNSDDLLTTPQLDCSGTVAGGSTTLMPRSHPGGSASELFTSGRRLLDSDDDQETTVCSQDDCWTEVQPHQSSQKVPKDENVARDENQDKGNDSSVEELPGGLHGSTQSVRLVVTGDSLASMFRRAQTGTQRSGSNDQGDRGSASVHLSDPAASGSAPMDAEMYTSPADHENPQREDINARSARQQRRLRHLQRMNAAPASLCVAIVFVNDAADADGISLPETRGVDVVAPAHRKEPMLHDSHGVGGSEQNENDDGGESAGSGSDFEAGVAHFHSTGSGHLLAEACRTAGTDYHCPTLEAQLSTLWTYAKHGAGSVERFDGTGLGWPLQTGDHWCTTHGNLQDCSLTLPPSALALTDAEPATASIAAAMGSLLTRKKLKNSAPKVGRKPKGQDQQREEGNPNGILAPVWENIVWNDGVKGGGGSGANSQDEKESLIVAPHLVFQVLVRGADLQKRPIASIARISTAVRTIAAWCVRAESISDVLMPCSLPTSGAALASLHHSAAATPPFEVLDAFLDELKITMDQQDRHGNSTHHKGVRRVVLLAGGGYPSQDKQTEHLAACKDAVSARATKLRWPIAM